MPKTRELMEGITIGADPELFIVNAETGEYVCPDGLIPGTKEEPHAVDGGAVQQDGFAAEFNIEPCTTYKEFSARIRGVKKQLQEMLPSNMILVPHATAKFTEDEWARASDETKVLGCSPDYNAWTLDVNPAPQAEDLVRCAGGHLHVGWTEGASPSDKEYFKACVDLVRQLDWCLGGWSVLKDCDTTRRTLYGQAGSMRFKPYGVEYRTLSNFWLENHIVRQHLWNRVCKAIDLMNGYYYPSSFADYNETLIKSINQSDTSTLLFRDADFTTPIHHL